MRSLEEKRDRLGTQSERIIQSLSVTAVETVWDSELR